MMHTDTPLYVVKSAIADTDTSMIYNQSTSACNEDINNDSLLGSQVSRTDRFDFMHYIYSISSISLHDFFADGVPTISSFPLLCSLPTGCMSVYYVVSRRATYTLKSSTICSTNR